MPDLTALLTDLRSPEADRRAQAIERAAIAVERMVHAVVLALETTGASDKEVFDRVHRFGPTMIAPVEALLHRSTDRGVRTLCALLLLRLHSRAGLDTLLAELESGGRWSVPIIEQLVQSELDFVAPRIIHRLREIPIDREEEILALLGALEHFQHSVPADVIPRIQRPGASESLRQTAIRIIEGQG